MSQNVQTGNTSVTGGVAISGYAIPATAQTVVFAAASTNHTAAGTPVLVRNNTGGKTFYLTWIDFYQSNSSTIPLSMKLYDDATQKTQHSLAVERVAANNAYAFGYVRITFPQPIPFATNVKVDCTAAMGTNYVCSIGGFEQ